MTDKQQRLALVFGCFIGTALGPSVTIFFTLGLFIAPFTKEFGWSQSEISLVIPALTLSIALTMPIAGMLIDRWGAKRVIILSMTSYGVSLFLFHFVHDIRAFYILFIILGIFCSGSNTVSFITVLAAWFDKNRGLMIGIATSGIGAGTLILSPIVQWMIDTAGWRSAYFVIGVIILTIGVPIFLVTLKNRPAVPLNQEESSKTIENGLDQDAAPASFSSIFRSVSFWLITIGFVSFQGAIYSVGVYLAPIIQNNGASVQFSVLCVSAFGGAALVGRILTGIFLDRFFAPFVCAVIFFGVLLGILALSMGVVSWFALAAAVLIGFSTGTEGDALGYLISRYVPRAVFARVYSIIFSCCMLSLAALPYLTGLAYDSFGNYQTMLWILAGLVAVAAICMLKMPTFPHFRQNDR